MFAIFADTFSKISNFAPPAKNDASARSNIGEKELKLELFAPFIYVKTTDVLADSSVYPKSIDKRSLYEFVRTRSLMTVYTLGR